MQSLFRYGLVAAVLSLFVAACGDSDDKKQDLGDPRGGVMISVKSLDSLADVDSVTVTLSDSENTYEILLAHQGNDVWTGGQQNLYVGEYDVEAEALDADGNLLFSAAPDQKVMIEKDTTTDVTIYLNELRDPGLLEFPHFEMITLSSAVVEQFETLTVTVTMDGGTAPYSIEGVNAVNPPAWNPSGSFSGANFTGNVGTIVWTPPKHAGPKWFKIVVTDDNGNKAEVGIDVTVGDDVGDVIVNAEFIVSPITHITGRILNDNEGTSVYLWVKPAEDNDTWATSVDYVWDHGTCGGVFESGAESGSWSGPVPSAGWYFKYQIDRPAAEPPATTPNGNPVGDPAGIGVCSITLTTIGDHGVTYQNVVEIDTEWVLPTN